VKLIIDVNVPFGAAIMLIYTWRRLTVAAIWCAVILSVTLNIVVPNTLAQSDYFSTLPSLTVKDSQDNGVYFEHVVHTDPSNLSSPLKGTGRFNLECCFLSYVGLHPEELNTTGRDTARYFFDGIFPFVVLMLVSLVTRQAPRDRVDLFYGKMKTQVAETPELDAAAMAETRANPHRFDHTKLFPGSSWEFGKWTREDGVGFIACLGVSAGIIGLFVLLLYIASLG
jgi:hypothetical protein